MHDNQHMNQYKDRQHGSALFLILIAVALFGALSYAVSEMLRAGGGANISTEKAAIQANEILDYGRTLRESIQHLRIAEGCSDSEISFENQIVAGYTNGVNTDCQIFHVDGGGMSWVSPAPDVNDGSEWLFVGSNIVDDVGTTAPDLVLILPNLDENICTQINEKTAITATGTDAAIDFTQFTGSYASTQTIDFAAANPVGCLNYVNSGNNFFFYQVLVAR